jgi:DNA gyrase subunit A
VKDEDEIIMVTNAGQMIRTPIITVRVAGRNTQGVNLFTLEKGEKVVSVAKVEGFEEVAPS